MTSSLTQNVAVFVNNRKIDFRAVIHTESSVKNLNEKKNTCKQLNLKTLGSNDVWF